jgi:tetratricopeptide (TPR) repeat protein
MVAAFDGDPEAAALHDQSTTDLGAAIGDDRIRVEGLRRRSMNQALMLDLDQAAVSLELATAAAEQLGSPGALAELEVLGRGLITMARGRYEDAVTILEPQVPTLERFASFDLPITHGLLGQARLELGEPETALASFMEMRRTALTGGQPFSEAVGAAGMAATYALMGSKEDTQSLLGQTKIGEGPMGDYFASSSWYYVGLSQLLLGDGESAIDAFNSGIAAPAVVQYLDRVRLLAGLSQALIDTGDLDRAGTILDEAREFVIDKHLDTTDPSLLIVKGNLQAAKGDTEEARAQLAEAVVAADALGQRWPAFRAAHALAQITGSLADAQRRRDDMVSRIVDPALADSFRTRWVVSSPVAT